MKKLSVLYVYREEHTGYESIINNGGLMSSGRCIDCVLIVTASESIFHNRHRKAWKRYKCKIKSMQRPHNVWVKIMLVYSFMHVVPNMK